MHSDEQVSLICDDVKENSFHLTIVRKTFSSGSLNNNNNNIIIIIIIINKTKSRSV